MVDMPFIRFLSTCTLCFQQMTIAAQVETHTLLLVKDLEEYTIADYSRALAQVVKVDSVGNPRQIRLVVKLVSKTG